jgi:UDP-2,3-diacylglucosamine pyrophosphatase LpxH
MIEAHPQIAIWIHGHTHRPENYRIGNTQVIANPRGYFPHESVARAFNPNAADFTLESVGA